MNYKYIVIAAVLLGSCTVTNKPAFITIGDSYSAGTGSRTNWPLILADDLNLKVINPSVNGYTAEDAIKQELPKLRDTAEFAIIMLGTNDYVQGRTPEEFKISLETIIQELKLRTNTIYIITIPDFTKSPVGKRFGTFKGIEAFNEIIRQLAISQELMLIEINEIEIPGYNDGLHPNEEGQKLWAAHILAKIKYD